MSLIVLIALVDFGHFVGITFLFSRQLFDAMRRHAVTRLRH